MILLLGGNGLFRSFFKKKLIKQNKKFVTVGRRNSDYDGNILNEKFLLKILKKFKPKTIINLVAITDVEYCEKKKNMQKRLIQIYP